MTVSKMAIARHLDCSMETAAWVRATLVLGEHGEDDAKWAMEQISKRLCFYGVEAIRGECHIDNYHYDIVATYLNPGDTYNATIVYETEHQRFKLTTFGDWVERAPKRYKIR